MQKVPNPVPRVKHPDWLARSVREKDDTFRQSTLGFMPAARPAAAGPAPARGDVDMEDAFGGAPKGPNAHPQPRARGFVPVPAGTGADGTAATTPATPAAVVPDRKTDFSGWLSVQKKQWAKLREQRKRSRAEVRPTERLAKTQSLCNRFFSWAARRAPVPRRVCRLVCRLPSVTPRGGRVRRRRARWRAAAVAPLRRGTTQ